jgi:hypothetical protein
VEILSTHTKQQVGPALQSGPEVSVAGIWNPKHYELKNISQNYISLYSKWHNIEQVSFAVTFFHVLGK